MTLKEAVAAYVDFFGDAEDAMAATCMGIVVLGVIGVMLWLVPLFTLGLLGLLGAGIGLFVLFLWASDEL